MVVPLGGTVDIRIGREKVRLMSEERGGVFAQYISEDEHQLVNSDDGIAKVLVIRFQRSHC